MLSVTRGFSAEFSKRYSFSIKSMDEVHNLKSKIERDVRI